ncbi:MAG: hypothetical protein ACRC2B_05920 [Rubrivivax sp.]
MNRVTGEVAFVVHWLSDGTTLPGKGAQGISCRPAPPLLEAEVAGQKRLRAAALRRSGAADRRSLEQLRRFNSTQSLPTNEFGTTRPGRWR